MSYEQMTLHIGKNVTVRAADLTYTGLLQAVEKKSGSTEAEYGQGSWVGEWIEAVINDATIAMPTDASVIKVH